MALIGFAAFVASMKFNQNFEIKNFNQLLWADKKHLEAQYVGSLTTLIIWFGLLDCVYLAYYERIAKIISLTYQKILAIRV